MCAEYVNAPSVSQVSARSFSVLASLLVLAGCGGSDNAAPDAPTPTASIVATTIVERSADDRGDTAVVCAELQVVQDLSAEVDAAVGEILSSAASGTSGTEAETVQSFIDLGNQLEANLPELLAAYDRAAAAASNDVADEIRTVADGTAVLTPALAQAFRNATSTEGLADIEGIFAEPGLQDAAQRAGIASLRLDNFTNPSCGFQFSNA